MKKTTDFMYTKTEDQNNFKAACNLVPEIEIHDYRESNIEGNTIWMIKYTSIKDIFNAGRHFEALEWSETIEEE